MGFLGHGWLDGWSPVNAFARDFSTSEGNASYLLPNFLYVLQAIGHPGLLWVGIPALVFIRREDFKGMGGLFLQWRF